MAYLISYPQLQHYSMISQLSFIFECARFFMDSNSFIDYENILRLRRYGIQPFPTPT